jgi:hypothetical protein
MDDPVCQYIPQESRSLAQKEGGEEIFQEVLKQARERNLLSDEHFTVHGTLIEGLGESAELSTEETGEAGE